MNKTPWFLLTLYLLLALLFWETVVLKRIYVQESIQQMAEEQEKENLQNNVLYLERKLRQVQDANKNKMSLTFRLTYPLKEFNATLSQGYGQNLLAYGGMGLSGHPGLDLVAPEGTPVYASHEGIVFEAFGGHSNARDGKVGYGNRVKLRARYGQQGEETVYAHLSKVSVKVGEYVEDGQLIGYTGNTGFSTRPHLHFGVRYLWYCDKGGKQTGKPCEVLHGNNGMMGWVDPTPKLK